MGTEPDLNGTQKEIVRLIDENPGINSTSISEEVDIKPPSVNHNIEKLKDANIVENKAIEHNKTRYELSDEVEVDVDYKLENLLNWKVGIHGVEILFLLAMTFIIPPELIFYAYIGFAGGFAPSLALTLQYVYSEADFSEIKVRKKSDS